LKARWKELSVVEAMAAKTECDSVNHLVFQKVVSMVCLKAGSTDEVMAALLGMPTVALTESMQGSRWVDLGAALTAGLLVCEEAV
jgi:hypothetical protein